MAADPKVKKDIMRFFASSKAKVGNAFNARGFNLRVMMHYDPKQKAAVGDSMKELADVDRFVEERQGEYHLTQLGFDHILPEGRVMTRGFVKRGRPR